MEINRDIFFKFFNGELSENESIELISWAEKSQDNYAMLEKERQLFDLLNLAPEECFAEPEVKVRRLTFVWKALSVAAGVAALIAAALFLRTPDKSQYMVADTVVTAPAGSRSLVNLPDGTQVWLNAGSSMTYSALPGKDGKREVSLEGQARFDVSKDEAHPFVVHTYLADIEVLGTSFDVIADKDRGLFETALFTGKVSITTPDGKTSCVLSPSQKVILGDKKLLLGSIENYDIYNWIDGLYCFRDRPFSQIILDMEKYFGTQIDCQVASAVADEKLTGKFRVSDGLDFALKVLQISLDFNYTFDESNESVIITD
ncbi:MAG: FecR domain-containing protein [Bacteroidales bacterium]|nr:FecR domain-containing protein [Bacteroidales bacterium]